MPTCASRSIRTASSTYSSCRTTSTGTSPTGSHRSAWTPPARSTAASWTTRSSSLAGTSRERAEGACGRAERYHTARRGKPTMSRQPRISRRGLLGAAAAASALGLAGGTRPARAAASRRALAGGEAQLPGRRQFVIRNAYVLTLDPALGDFERGDVHVRNGEIRAVGPDLDAPGAEVIDGRGLIALPGLVDTHWHLWNSPYRGGAGPGVLPGGAAPGARRHTGGRLSRRAPGAGRGAVLGHHHGPQLVAQRARAAMGGRRAARAPRGGAARALLLRHAAGHRARPADGPGRPGASAAAVLQHGRRRPAHARRGVARVERLRHAEHGGPRRAAPGVGDRPQPRAADHHARHAGRLRRGVRPRRTP